MTQSTTGRRDFRRGGRLSENHLGIGGAFWRRCGLTELSVRVALGGGICVSALSDKRRLVDGQWPVALRGLSGAGVGDGWSDLLGQQAAAGDVVSSDLVTQQSEKTGVNALGLQRQLGLGSYKTASTMLHKLRWAMVRPGRKRLQGVVEVDEAYWGGAEENVRGRQTYEKALIAVAVEAASQRNRRIRLRNIADTKRKILHGFSTEVNAPGSTVQTDGLHAYRELQAYVHEPQVQSRQSKDDEYLLSRAHFGNLAVQTLAARNPSRRHCP